MSQISRLQSALSSSQKLSEASQLSTAANSNQFRIRSATSSKAPIAKNKSKTMKVMPSKKVKTTRSLTNLSASSNDRHKFDEVPSLLEFACIEEAPLELENQATPANDYENHLAKNFSQKLFQESDLDVISCSSGAYIISGKDKKSQNLEKPSERKYLFKSNLRDTAIGTETSSRLMNYSEIPDTEDESDDLDSDSVDQIPSRLPKVASTKTITSNFGLKKTNTRFGETDGFANKTSAPGMLDAKLSAALFCITKVSKPKSFIKPIVAKGHWDYYSVKNAHMTKPTVHKEQASNKDESINNPFLNPHHFDGPELTQLENSASDWLADTWTQAGKWLPFQDKKPCYNLRGETKAANPRLKQNLQNLQLQKLIAETKQIAINGPDSVVSSRKKPDFKIEMDAADQMVIRTQPIQNKFPKELTEVPEPQPKLRAPRRLKKVPTREELKSEIFDEAMLDDTYTSNLAYQTGCRPRCLSKSTTTQSSKIIRTPKNHSNLHKSTTKPNIFADLKKKTLVNGLRLGMQKNDQEGRRVCKFMGDLQNSDLCRTDRFFMVKGADRRDVKEIMDDVSNKYLDEMLNKVADI